MKWLTATRGVGFKQSVYCTTGRKKENEKTTEEGMRAGREGVVNEDNAAGALTVPDTDAHAK